jgi:hypothetical protein
VIFEGYSFIVYGQLVLSPTGAAVGDTPTGLPVRDLAFPGGLQLVIALGQLDAKLRALI